MSGWSAAASDQDFGPLTTTSTKRTAWSSVRSRPPRLAAVGVATGDPSLVGVPSQRRQLLHPPSACGVAAGQSRALGQVVVVSPASVRLEVGARSGRRPCVDLHSAAHCQRRPTMANTSPLETAKGPAKQDPDSYHW